MEGSLDIRIKRTHLGHVDNLVFALAGLGVGLFTFVLYFLAQKKSQRKREEDLLSLQKEKEILQATHSESKQLEEGLRKDLLLAQTECARNDAHIEELERRLKEQSEEQAESARQMHEKFENLANRIFEKKTEKFSDLNQEKLKVMLQPLDKDIREFRKKVEELHEKETHQHVALREFVSGLQKAQSQLSEDARNLTRALKGDAKKQGDWGEFILERALESSGLNRGQEFSMQTSFDGKRPDAIIYLPGKRHLIIDAKVSLTAYERSISADSDEAYKIARKQHLQSVRKHIDELSAKDYSAIEELGTPDFTFLFIPVEPAFGAAISDDPELYQYAFDRKIALITASTLMATIKTVANLWKLEKQNKHAQDIAKRAGLLCDKFAGFLSNMEDIGKSLRKALGAHDRAVSQLSTGPGNLLSQTEKLKAMGVPTKKEIPAIFSMSSESGGGLPATSDLSFDPESEVSPKQESA